MACGRLGTVKEGAFKDLTIEGPEYETIYAFGALCGVRTIEEIAHLNRLCDGLGMDTISAGNIIGLIMEASKRGLLNIKVELGDTNAIGKLLCHIAFRNGIGEILAEGILKASEILGLSELAIHIKGMEPAGYDPRVLKGMALAYATSPRGACHLRSTFYKAELMGLFNPDDLESMVEVFVDWEDRLTLMDSMIFCRFYRDLYPWETLEEIYGLITGDYGHGLRETVKTTADKIRAFNLQQGMDPSQDWLPKRFFKEALPETGEVLKEEEVREMIRLYYAKRGWDEKGQPKKHI
jgi:aldehyde:ferredoxin oxidoreductase